MLPWLKVLGLRKILIIVFLTLSVLLGTFLRLNNISPYKIYPDSYQNLLVSINLATRSTVVAPLGENGIVYPPYLMWTRSVYPLLSNLFDIFTKDLEFASQTVSLFAGVLTILIAYLFVKEVTGSQVLGVLASLLTAVSFNHTIWSGYIMSDTTGILLSFVYWFLLFRSLRASSGLLETKDLATGLFLSLAFFARYEYIVFLIPTLVLIALYKKSAKNKIINIFASFIFTTSIILSLFYPLPQLFPAAVSQFPTLLFGFLIIVIVALLLLALKNKIKFPFTQFHYLRFPFVLLGVGVLPFAFFDLSIPLLTGYGNFVKTDFLMMSLFFIGMGAMLTDPKLKKIFIFCMILAALMGAVYYRINPLQQRYYTHLLPVIVLTASFGAQVILKKIMSYPPAFRVVSGGAILILLIVQLNTSWWGIQNWHEGDWGKPSYEQTAVALLKPLLKGDEILLVALPEPYFFFTQQPTQSVAVSYPFVSLNGIDENDKIVIVNDMAMRDIFPDFSKLVGENLSDQKIIEYFTNTRYRYRDYSLKEKYPVQVYLLTKRQLQTIVEQ